MQHQASPFTSPLQLLPAASDRLTHPAAISGQAPLLAPCNPSSPQAFSRKLDFTNDAIPNHSRLHMWQQAQSAGNSPVLNRHRGQSSRPVLEDKACSPMPLQVRGAEGRDLSHSWLHKGVLLKAEACQSPASKSFPSSLHTLQRAPTPQSSPIHCTSS